MRRVAIIDALVLADTAIPAAAHPPFGPGRRHGQHDPASSYYCEASDALAVEAGGTVAYGFDDPTRPVAVPAA